VSSSSCLLLEKGGSGPTLHEFGTPYSEVLDSASGEVFKEGHGRSS
jgi:hypothetical protein